MTIIDTPDPTELTLAELRGLRQQLQHEDDAVSYARRVAQARLDLVKSEATPPCSGVRRRTDRRLRTVLVAAPDRRPGATPSTHRGSERSSARRRTRRDLRAGWSRPSQVARRCRTRGIDRGDLRLRDADVIGPASPFRPSRRTQCRTGAAIPRRRGRRRHPAHRGLRLGPHRGLRLREDFPLRRDEIDPG